MLDYLLSLLLLVTSLLFSFLSNSSIAKENFLTVTSKDVTYYSGVVDFCKRFSPFLVVFACFPLTLPDQICYAFRSLSLSAIMFLFSLVLFTLSYILFCLAPSLLQREIQVKHDLTIYSFQIFGVWLTSVTVCLHLFQIAFITTFSMSFLS